MNVMNHFRMSDLTTPRELMDANLDDREKLELGLESRTTCCFSPESYQSCPRIA